MVVHGVLFLSVLDLSYCVCLCAAILA